MWDHARSGAEIRAGMAGRLSGLESGLLGYWPMDEEFGTNIYDHTSYASTGTVIGASWSINNSLTLYHGLAVSALPPLSVSRTNATANGRLEFAGFAENPAVTVCWGDNDAGTNTLGAWDHVSFLGDNWGNGETFTHLLAPLDSGMTYGYRFFVSNSTGTAWSDWAALTTPQNLYVSLDGSDANDGTSWATALATISNGIALATTVGDTVLVSNGTYQIYATLEITNGITLQSVNGAAVTIVDAGNRAQVGCFRILHQDAVLEGFTATRGKMDGVAQTSGGIHMSAGTVRWCRIIANYGDRTGENVGGGAVNMSGGLMHHCVIQDTPNAIYNGTIYLTGDAILRNCLVTDNNYRRGGGIYMTGSSRVENCTVVRNNGSEHTGGIYRSNGTVVNTIIYFNTDPTVDYDNWRGSAGFYYCCSDPLPPGGDNIADDPLLVDIANRDYRLLPGSPVIGAGTTNLAWLADNPDEVDLDGNPRVVDGAIDMGAYQYTLGALDCGFVGEPVVGIAPLEVTFSSVVAGANTNGLTYYWDFDDDGTLDSFAPHPTHVYEPGLFNVSLWVSNAVGEGAYYERLDYIKAGPATNYVSTTGSNVFPYVSWQTAATDLQSALDAAVDGTLIRVADGVYNHSETYEVLKGVTIRSENGVDATTLLLAGADGRRSLYLNHPEVVVDGFTLIRTTASTWGGGVRIHNFGTLQNCAILNGKHNHGYGANLTMNAGTVRNCLIAGGEDRHVGGFTLGGGLLENCVVVSNRNIQTTSNGAVGGGRVTGAGAVIRNCLVRNNWGVGQTGGLLVSAGLVENCTVVDNTVDNTDATTAGGLRLTSGTVRNTILAFNENPNGGASTNWYRSGGTLEYSCTTPSAAAFGDGNIAADPLLRNRAAGDYRIGAASPCFNAGLTRTWMAEALDLAGAPRVVGRAVDIGAYESQALPATILLLR